MIKHISELAVMTVIDHATDEPADLNEQISSILNMTEIDHATDRVKLT